MAPRWHGQPHRAAESLGLLLCLGEGSQCLCRQALQLTLPLTALLRLISGQLRSWQPDAGSLSLTLSLCLRCCILLCKVLLAAAQVALQPTELKHLCASSQCKAAGTSCTGGARLSWCDSELALLLSPERAFQVSLMAVDSTPLSH